MEHTFLEETKSSRLSRSKTRPVNLRFDIGEIAILMKLSVSNLFATINNILKIHLYIFIGSTEILMVKSIYIRHTEGQDFTNSQNWDREVKTVLCGRA